VALHPSYLGKKKDYIIVLCRVKIRSEGDSQSMSTLGKRKNRETSDFHGSVMLFLSFSIAILIFDRSTLFVSNLPYTATSTDLNTLFSDIAPVRSAFVVLEHGTGASKGVGYVSFAIAEDAKAAFDSISADGIALDGRKLRIEWAANKVC
jgi:nucleolar protein 4